MAKDYDIARASGSCSACGRELAGGQAFVAALFDEGPQFRREDFCPGCWDARADGQRRAFSVWHGRKALPQQPRRQFVSDDLLLEFFDRLAEQTEPAKVNFRFVLALMLMRKKLLIYDRSLLDEAGRDVWVMHFKGGSELRVVHPVLDERQLAELSAQLSAILEEPT